MALSPPTFPSLPELAPLGERPNRRRRRQPPPTLTEEERRSLLGSALGGLAYVGGAIDKPFAATRGTVAALGDLLQGKPRKAKEHAKQLLHLIPFSGTFREPLTDWGIPVPEEHIWGREVLESFGAPRNRPGGMTAWGRHPEEAFWDLAGIATDLFVTPPVMPGLLPLTKAAQLAGKGSRAWSKLDDLVRAGRTEEAAAEAARLTEQATGALGPAGGKLKDLPGRLAAPTPAAKIQEIKAGERALVGLRPTWGPWRAALGKEPVATLGTGEKAAAVADWLYYGQPITPILRSALGATTRGVRGGAAQRALEEEVATHMNVMGTFQGLAPVLDAEMDDLANVFTQRLAQFASVAGDKVGHTNFQRFSRYVAEQRSVVEGQLRMTSDEISKLFQIPGDNLEALQGVTEFARRFANLNKTMGDTRDTLRGLIAKYGGKASVLNAAFTAHLPRRRIGGMTSDTAARMESRFNHGLHRLESFDVPEGAVTINSLVAEGLWTRPASKELAAIIRTGGPRSGAFKRHDVVTLSPDASVKQPFEGFGRIVAFQKDQAIVSRIAPEGYVDQVSVPIRALKAAPEQQLIDLVPPNLRTKKEQLAEMRAMLQKRGVAVPKKASEIRAQSLLHSRLNPAWQREVARGLEIPDTVSWIDAGSTQLERQARTAERLATGVPAVYRQAEGRLAKVASESKSVSQELAAWLGRTPALPEGLFNRAIVEDHGTYLTHGLEFLHGLFAKHNFLRGVASTEAQPGWIPLADAWKSVTTRFGRKRATRRALSDEGLDTFAAEFAAERKLGSLSASDIYVPEGTAKALQTFQDMMEPGSGVSSAFGQMYDLVMASFRAGVTSPWPAFHFRNWTAGQFQNLAADLPITPSQYVDAYKEVWRWRWKGDDFAYLKEIQEMNLLKRTRMADVAAETGRFPTRTWLPAKGEMTWDPRKFRGAAEALGKGPMLPGEAQFVPLAVGDHWYSIVELFNRAPLYVALRKHAGFTPAQALQAVKRIQYDYGAMTPFERTWMRKGFSFYGWLKNNAIYHAGEIMGNPGGKLGTAIRMAAASGRQHGGQLPRWLQQEMAIPLAGSEQEKVVLRGLGLPFEDLKTIQPTWGRTAQRMLAQMHPLISTAAKLYGKTDPYTGLPLDHWTGPTGIWQMDAILSGAPTARAYTTYRRLGRAAVTPEKAPVLGLDLLTGLKLGLHDVEQARLDDMARAGKEMLDRHPQIWKGEHFYIPKRYQAKAGAKGKKAIRQVTALSREAQALRQKRALQEKP